MATEQLTARKRKHSDVTPSKLSFFDALPYDALTMIIRHLSARPYTDKWLHYIEHDHLFVVLKSEGKLKTATRDLVTQLRVFMNNNGRFKEQAAVFGELLPHLNSLWVNWNFDIIIPVHLTTFSYQFEIPQLRTLDIHCRWPLTGFPLDNILSACGGTLHNLRIHATCTIFGIKEIYPITQHCRQLESLCISGRQFDEPHLLPLWIAFGRSLTKLHLLATVGPSSNDLSFVSAISEHCPRLQDVGLYHSHGNWLYKKLGAQLKVVKLVFSWHSYRPKREELVDILKSCPNVKVHLRSCIALDSPEQILSALSGRLFALDLNFVSPVPALEFPMLRDVSLRLSHDQSTLIEQFFSIPRPNLRKLTLSNVRTGDAFDIIAKSVSFLDVLELRIAPSFYFSDTDCDELLLANTRLRRFHMEYFYVRDAREIERLTVAQLRCLKHCKELVEFEISGGVGKKLSTLIDDACVALRNRQLIVDVGGVHYLPA